ncbi:MAG TPA: methyltransferase domain-containing protein [Acetobacteraceae bacterium]|nr:methyltransferase domain-containing protein [Acetobacteraceae bacterium]
MPDIEWNKSTWADGYDWSNAGEEWSGPWGTSSAEWFATIMPRIGSTLPAVSILEIAPGFGRWTEFLLRFCRSYCGIDLSDRCVNNCQQRFAKFPNAKFFVNDGKSLDAVAGRRFNLVFSFDALVHADLDAMAFYVPQIVRLLAPGGVAFLHHSNLAALPNVSFGHRSENVSAEAVGDLIRNHNGRILVQERFSWGENLLTDCFSMFCRAEDYPGFESQDITDAGLISVEGKSARERFQYYLKLR